jgi:nitronate monooxygenase
MDFGTEALPKAWKEIWGAGQSVSGIHEIDSVAKLVDKLEREYLAALGRLNNAA